MSYMRTIGNVHGCLPGMIRGAMSGLLHARGKHIYHLSASVCDHVKGMKKYDKWPQEVKGHDIGPGMYQRCGGSDWSHMRRHKKCVWYVRTREGQVSRS